MQINAAVARKSRAPLSLENLEIEAPRPEEILVKVVATGVCHTDIVVRDGMLPTPLPVVLGHEGAGVVEAVGAAVTKVKPSDHVVMTFNACRSMSELSRARPELLPRILPAQLFRRAG